MKRMLLAGVVGAILTGWTIWEVRGAMVASAYEEQLAQVNVSLEATGDSLGEALVWAGQVADSVLVLNAQLEQARAVADSSGSRADSVVAVEAENARQARRALQEATTTADSLRAALDGLQALDVALTEQTQARADRDTECQECAEANAGLEEQVDSAQEVARQAEASSLLWQERAMLSEEELDRVSGTAWFGDWIPSRTTIGLLGSAAGFVTCALIVR